MPLTLLHIAAAMAIAGALAGTAQPVSAQTSMAKGKGTRPIPRVDLSNPDVAAIVQIGKDFSATYKAGDADHLASFYSPDVYMGQV